MVFTSPTFLFLFLPLTLLAYVLSPTRARNAVLLGASLLFYVWGEPIHAGILLVSMAMNYGAGRIIDRVRGSAWGPFALGLAVAANLGLLAWFKYANFAAANLDAVMRALGGPPIALGTVHLPIGISFFTFHGLSYVIDVYRGTAVVLQSPVSLGLYLVLFPQLIAGPIVRYKQIATQLERRVMGLEPFAEGVRRFVIGLGRKMIIANPLGLVVDQIMGLPIGHLSTSVAWLGIGCYTLQIYFDFAGYSDMAIGLARMFGFQFPENFRDPYQSTSIREFWTRWHISLSSWFRDYLYIPLGGNRGRPARTYANLCTVFFLCGLWHGASWNFVIWGLLHGAFLVLERLPLGQRLLDLPRALRHAYVLLVVMVGWVFFRSDTLGHALGYLGTMAGAGHGPLTAPMFLDRETLIVLALGIAWCVPWSRSPIPDAVVPTWNAAELVSLAAMLVIAVMYVAAGTYNPFIYFRF